MAQLLPRHLARRLLRHARQFSSSASASTFATDGAMFSKILVANRGEIACRVMRTAREKGIRTVAVYSDAEANAQHVQLADEAYCIGRAPASESYLKQQEILDVCLRAGAQAVHPGYGFLSENAAFAQACADSGICFIGPPPGAIISMGSKSESKIIMEAANVPCTPGYHGEDQSLERLKKEAEAIGFPVMLKAVMGGGGKGMRVVEDASTLEENIEACKREAENSFGDGRILIERYLRRPRHVEMQVFADTFGNTVHLFERDCSVQRRHQKVLEEAPAPMMPEALRQRMGEAAVNAAKAVGYVGAGTVEFMLDATDAPTEDSDFFFMEMNTRLQVEHPVTEMVTGLDLVALQLHVAAGRPLPFSQDDVRMDGHALEARIYAESPGSGFLPGVGRVSYLSQPESSHHGPIRVDSGLIEGDEVSIYYDPMIAKLVVHGADREEALRKLREALAAYHVAGIPTNVEFLKACLDHPAFITGGVDTSFIEKHHGELLGNPPSPLSDAKAAAIATLVKLIQAQRKEKGAHAPGLFAFRTHSSVDYNQKLSVATDDGSDARELSTTCTVVQRQTPPTGDLAIDISVSSSQEDQAEVSAGGFSFKVEGRAAQDDQRRFFVRLDGAAFHVSAYSRGETLTLFAEGALDRLCYSLKEINDDGADIAGHSANSIKPPMPGRIVKVLVAEGDDVKKGDALVQLEAMKMVHVMKAPKDGKIKEVKAVEGDFVDDSFTLVSFE